MKNLDFKGIIQRIGKVAIFMVSVCIVMTAYYIEIESQDSYIATCKYNNEQANPRKIEFTKEGFNSFAVDAVIFKKCIAYLNEEKTKLFMNSLDEDYKQKNNDYNIEMPKVYLYFRNEELIKLANLGIILDGFSHYDNKIDYSSLITKNYEVEPKPDHMIAIAKAILYLLLFYVGLYAFICLIRYIATGNPFHEDKIAKRVINLLRIYK